MKKTILTIAAGMFVAGTILTGCSSPSEKVEDAQANVQQAKEDVKDAKQDLVQAQKDSVTEFQKFKNESNEAIATNEKNIADLKTEMKTEKAKAKAAGNKKIDALEKENNKLKAKLEAYKDDGKSDWKEFKTEFNHDLAGLGKAFKDITVRNTK